MSSRRVAVRRAPAAAVVATVALALGLALAGCTSSSDAGTPVATAPDAGFVSGVGRVQVLPQEQRRPAPDVKGTDLDGRPLDLAAARGKVTVVNVWGSWCPPCREETPTLVRVAKATEAEGVAFVGINTRDQQAAARAFVAEAGVPYPSFYDPDGELLLAFRGTLPPQAIPSTLAIDARGRVAGRIIGPVTEPRLRELIDPLVAEARQ